MEKSSLERKAKEARASRKPTRENKPNASFGRNEIPERSCEQKENTWRIQIARVRHGCRCCAKCAWRSRGKRAGTRQSARGGGEALGGEGGGRRQGEGAGGRTTRFSLKSMPTVLMNRDEKFEST